VKNSQLDGVYKSFYPNGKLKSESNWVHGRRTGIASYYFKSGVLQSRSHLTNGLLNGTALQYYQNGILSQKGVYTNGTQTGITLLFDSLTGKPVERHIYNQAGQLIYLNDYDKQGKPSRNGLTSIVDAPDTIKWGANYTGCIRFGYPLTGKVTMLIGKLVTRVKSIDRYQIADTFAIVHPDKQGRFCFSYHPQPAQIGRNMFGYKFLHTGSVYDSLSVNELSGSWYFFVKKPKNNL
jgi:hypothetical protein